MTSINSIRNNSAALSLLQQTQVSPFSGHKSQNAADTILDTLSSKISNIQSLAATAQKAKDAIQAAKTSHKAETESTILSAWKSAMASVGAAEVGAGGTSIAPTVDNAEAIVGGLAWAINDYNGKFDLQTIPTREAHEASKNSSIVTWISEGLNEKLIANSLEYGYGEGGYERHVSNIEARNQGLLRASELGADMLEASVDRLKEAFGIKVQVSYDAEGHASVGAFDINYRNGQKMLSYGEDGSLTSYNEDGTVKLSLDNKQAAMRGMGYYYNESPDTEHSATRLLEILSKHKVTVIE